MTPPELSRDTPILDTLQPAVPFIFRRLGVDSEFASLGALDGFLSKRLAVHPPLRFEYRFDDITRFTIGTKVGFIVRAQLTEVLTRR